MNPTTTLQSLLAHDLKVRSSGSYGRHLIERLDEYCVDRLGADTPLQFAIALQDPTPGPRRGLEEFLEWTPLDNDFRLIALVALSSSLASITDRLAWGRAGQDMVSEVLAQATEALRWTNELIEGERVDFVLEQTLTKTRNEQRRLSRHNVTTTFIPDECDAGEPEAEPYEIAPSLLARAVANHVICEADALLIWMTRGERISLQVLAHESDTSYDALRMRRARAETLLRRRFRTTDLR